MIRVEKLSKAFGSTQEIRVLHDVELHVQPGDVYGIIGKSGAGKSTLLRCISLLGRPTSGRILIEGTDISTLRGRSLIEMRKKVGVIFQGYNLLMQRRVRDNIAFPLELSRMPKAQRWARVDELLEVVGLADKANAYPAQLSGGQKQRVAIARALANHPSILLCDEPTSALDSFTTRSILELLADINRKLGVTIIIITHEMSVVKAICSKVAVINEGRIIEKGTTQEVFDYPQSEITRLLLGETGGNAHA